MRKNAAFPLGSEKVLSSNLPRTEARSPAVTTFFGVALLDELNDAPLLWGRLNLLSKPPNQRARL